MNPNPPDNRHHVLIIGGGFGGLYAAQALGDAPARVTLADRRNFHLFQPLLYQVATGQLSPGDIASPLRAILKNQANLSVIQAEIVDLDPQAQVVYFKDGELSYDSLILATGAETHYFGRPDWERRAPGLKNIEDALDMRGRVLRAFEAAEKEDDDARRQAWLTFVIIGGGPTGVELAGAIAELARATLRGEFRRFDPAQAQIILLEGQGRILPEYPAQSSAQAQAALEKMGVRLITNALVEDIQPESVTYRLADGTRRQVQTHTALWAAGMRASSLTRVLEQRAGARLDRSGRVQVDERLNLPGYPNIFVIGDMAHFDDQVGKPLPGVAPVAMQQGRHAAKVIRARLAGREAPAFAYRDKGSLAVIGRNLAVAVFNGWRISGFPAWIAWVFIHIWYLIEFDNKLLVLFQWAWNYFTRKRGARLITAQPEGEAAPNPALFAVYPDEAQRLMLAEDARRN